MRKLGKLLAKILAGLVVLALLLLATFVAVNWAPDRPVSDLEARWATPPSTFIDIEGQRVHLRDEGPRDDDTPIVLFHGTSASLHTWDGWAAELSQDRRVIRVDLPGFGLTGPPPSGDYTLEAYVRFVRALLDQLGVKKCVLAGNSFGGAVSIAVVNAMPERVSRLVLVDAAGYAVDSVSVPIGFRVARTPVLNRIALVTLPRSVIESSLKNVYGDPTKVTPELIDRYYELTLREGNRGAVAERFRQVPPGAAESTIASIKVPTLILWGARDRLIPLEYGQRFHRDIQGSELIVFEDLGHVPQEEDPERTVLPVKAFLAGK
ncbi:MAG: alpha/beta hydrolase [Polyangiaceae bacterium]|nr:alpha/beta hydrolase [Polyangiaceae bacterium]